MASRPTSSFGLPTQRAAAPTQQEAQREFRLGEQIQEGAAVQLAEYSNNFGQVAFPHDPEDTHAKLKGQLAFNPQIRKMYLGQGAKGEGDELADVPVPQLTVPLTDSDVAYYAKKSAEDEHLAFMQFCASKFDLTDPAQVEIFRRINPEYFTRQMAYIDSRLDTIKKWLSIRETGIQSMEDMTFLWMLNTGRLSLPLGYATFEELATAAEFRDGELRQKGVDQQFGLLGYNNRGIFNPLRLFATDTQAYPINSYGWSTTGDVGAVPNAGAGFMGGVYSQARNADVAPMGRAVGRGGAFDSAAFGR